MRIRFLLLFGLLTLTVLPALGQSSDTYQVKLDGPIRIKTMNKEGGGTVTEATLEFKIYKDGREVETLDGDYRITVLEEGKKVASVDLGRAKGKQPPELSVVLALDVCGGMAEGQGEKNRMFQARQASNAFLAKLPRTAEAGLVLFNHEVCVALPLSKDRAPLKAKIDEARPQGGTAYLDGCLQAINMLKEKKTTANRQKAVVLMPWDGTDLNSKHTAQQVIRAARKAGVKVFTIGIGNPSIDEKELAAWTGGKYYPAKNGSDLKLILERVPQNIARPPHSITYRVLNQVATSLNYTVTLRLERITVIEPGDEIRIQESKSIRKDR